MLSGYAAYAASKTTDVLLRRFSAGIGSSAAPYMPRYCAPVDSRITMTTFMPRAAPVRPCRVGGAASNALSRHAADTGAAADTRGHMTSAVSALRSNPRVSIDDGDSAPIAA